MEPPSSLEEIDLELGNCSTAAASDKIVEDEQDDNDNDYVASEYDASNTAKADNASSGTASSSSSDGMMVTEEVEKEDEDAASSTCVTDDCSTHIRIPCHPAAAAEDEHSTKTRTRDVPINCPICLSTYQPSDPICYSPNYPKCSHVFHQSCIIKWFVEVGRHDSTIVIGHYDSLLSMKEEKSRLNDEKYLLGYRLECPCCRQVFVGDDDEVCQTKEDKDDGDDEGERIDEDGSKEKTMVAIERVLEKEEREDGSVKCK